MKNGINLATHPIRKRGFMQTMRATVVLLALLATGVHLTWWVRARSAVSQLRDDVDRMQHRVDLLSQRTKTAQQSLERKPSSDVIQRLIALERSGATETVPPTVVLGVTADALPSDARVLSLWLESSPPDADVTIEALVGSPQSVADFVSGLSGSKSVVETEILEERHQSDGEILLRVGVTLTSRGTKQ